MLNYDGTAGASYSAPIFDFSSGSPKVWNNNTEEFETYNASNIAYYGNRMVEGPPTTFAVAVPTSLPENVPGSEYIAKVYNVHGANAVEAIPFVDSTGSGTFTLTYNGITTAAITYSATYGTLVTNINNALNTTFGTSQIVASASSLATVILTFSGPNYCHAPLVGHVTSTITGTGFTINGSGTAGTSTTTTAGVGFAATDISSYGALLETKFTWNGEIQVTPPVTGYAPSPIRNTWFVFTTGSDTNNGQTPASAFKTISKANGVSKTGDNIYVDAATAASISNYAGITATIRSYP
jgi:hypothetical protein